MPAQNKEPRTVGAVPRLKGDDIPRPKICNSQAKLKQREYREGWSRWVEPEAPCFADDFLEDWGDAIVQLRASNHYELNREASAWQRAMHAYAHWRAA